jgi:cytochrome c553
MRILALVLLAVAACAPRPAPTLPGADASRQADPVLIERGRYLAEHVAACASCHTDRSPIDHAVETGPRWAGGLHFDDEMQGVPGTVVSTDLGSHPTEGLGGWRDDEIMRALREGRSRDGRALVPVMPYRNYRALSDRDAAAIVAFLRTLPPVERHRPEPSRLRFPWSLGARMLAGPGPRSAAVAATDPVSRGSYLATLMGCADCHTASRRGRPRAGREQAGGVVLTFADGSRLVTPNITPDPDTGLAEYSLEDWLRLVREGLRRGAIPIAYNVMPWTAWRGMTDADLADVYAWLRALEPVRLDVHKPRNQVPMGR